MDAFHSEIVYKQLFLFPVVLELAWMYVWKFVYQCTCNVLNFNIQGGKKTSDMNHTDIHAGSHPGLAYIINCYLKFADPLNILCIYMLREHYEFAHIKIFTNKTFC